jgi:hypothetical protein
MTGSVRYSVAGQQFMNGEVLVVHLLQHIFNQICLLQVTVKHGTQQEDSVGTDAWIQLPEQASKLSIQIKTKNMMMQSRTHPTNIITDALTVNKRPGVKLIDTYDGMQLFLLVEFADTTYDNEDDALTRSRWCVLTLENLLHLRACTALISRGKCTSEVCDACQESRSTHEWLPCPEEFTKYKVHARSGGAVPALLLGHCLLKKPYVHIGQPLAAKKFNEADADARTKLAYHVAQLFLSGGLQEQTWCNVRLFLHPVQSVPEPLLAHLDYTHFKVCQSVTTSILTNL